MQISPREIERRQTKAILLRFALVSVGIPSLVVAIVWSYALLMELELRNRDLKNVALCIWLGTLAVLVRDAFLAARSGAGDSTEPPWRSQLRAGPTTAGRSPGHLRAWESKKSRHLLKGLWLHALCLPVLAGIFTALGFYFFAIEANKANVKLAVLVIWGGTLVGLLRM
ncbi:MAG: hypothetical protein KDD69_01960, partial [Bdellovibrionales bacterium]|nr:hypothetical protein [Bdellovibrionales bacterium]